MTGPGGGFVARVRFGLHLLQGAGSATPPKFALGALLGAGLAAALAAPAAAAPRVIGDV